jgi:hypothetical protein
MNNANPESPPDLAQPKPRWWMCTSSHHRLPPGVKTKTLVACCSGQCQYCEHFIGGDMDAHHRDRHFSMISPSLVACCRQDPEVCNCECHRDPENVQHCMPCCFFCSKCGRSIKAICFDDHEKRCGNLLGLTKQDGDNGANNP